MDINIKNVEFMPQYGIALVRLTYDESFNYWLEREKQKKGIMKQIEDLYELNIGHSIIARSVFVGLEQAVNEMKNLIK